MVDNPAQADRPRTSLMTRAGIENITALGVFLLVAAFLTFPVILQPGSVVIGRVFEDAFESIWYLHWYKHALFDLHVSPLFQPDIFYPLGWDLRFSIFPPFYPTVLSPLTWLFGPVAAYNLSLIGSCVFAAYGMYLLIKAVGGNIWGGLLAGVCYAFFPQREVYLGGHLNFLFGSMWLPWMVYGIVQSVKRPEQRMRWCILGLTAYALAVAGAWQFIFIDGLVLLVSAAIYWWRPVRQTPRIWLKPLVSGMLVAGFVVIPLLWGGVSARSQIGTSAEFSFAGVDSSSTSIERLIVPSALNPLVWDLARKVFPLTNGGDDIVALGYIAFLLAAYYLIKERKSSPHRTLGIWLVLSGVVLMLGTTLHFWGKPVLIALPPPVAEQISHVVPALIAGNALHIPLPASILYWLLPPFRSFHGFSRFGVIAAAGLSLLAGLGLTAITQRLRSGWRLMVGGIAVLVLVIEFNTQPQPNWQTTAGMHRAVDDWLAAQPERSVIIEYPQNYTWKGQSLYYTIAHGQKIVNGYSSILPAGVAEMRATLNQWPEPRALDFLQQIGVKYVLVDSFVNDNFETKQLPQLLSIPRLKLIQVFPTNVGPVKDIYLFELQSVTRSQP